MTVLPRDLLTQVLRQPGKLTDLTPSQWDLLVRQARSAGLLARLGWLFDVHGLSSRVPLQVAAHFESALQLALAQRVEIEREVSHVQQALHSLGVPLILLKGAAYVTAGLPAAQGRLFSDTDILLPKRLLEEAEAALMQGGWATTHHTAYDQRYYRQWMHELPPMVHVRRQTVLDVHHAIAPETARIRPDSGELLSASVRIVGSDSLATLSPRDMVLHSALHLLVNDDLSHGLRDLSDIDLLLRHFGRDQTFWDSLLPRSEELGLERVAFYALYLAQRVLGTPIPTLVQQAAMRYAPPRLVSWVMFGLWQLALSAPHHSMTSTKRKIALFALYLRAHWMRMPMTMLLRHLWAKAFRAREI
jgi:hypothetical protein